MADEETTTTDAAGNVTTKSYKGRGIDEAAQGAASRQAADAAKLRSKITATAPVAVGGKPRPKQEDYASLSEFGQAIAKWREENSATPQKRAISDKLAAAQ